MNVKELMMLLSELDETLPVVLKYQEEILEIASVDTEETDYFPENSDWSDSLDPELLSDTVVILSNN
jgi:hypothetical protein